VVLGKLCAKEQFATKSPKSRQNISHDLVGVQIFTILKADVTNTRSLESRTA
jgi:hypothetical protein